MTSKETPKMTKSAIITLVFTLIAQPAMADVSFDSPGKADLKGLIADIDVPAAAAAAPVSYRAGNKIIFGEDDRVEYFQAPEGFREAADSVVSLWRSHQLKREHPDQPYSLAMSNYGESFNLCPGVRFAEQSIGAFCSGALVGEDLVLTAGHCIKDETVCKNTKFVFGFGVKGEGEAAPGQVPESDVYGCAEIIKRDWTNYTVSQNGGPQHTTYGDDFALVRLDRKVTGRKPLAVARDGGIKKGDAVMTMGHPSGLPLKISTFATVVKPVGEHARFFVTNLDSFGGNSGGPVFNAATGLIAGVLVRGDADSFLQTFEGCTIFHVKPQNAGAGVSVNKLDKVLELIPELPL
jgi:V8-like Glu-specific endopeptidase